MDWSTSFVAVLGSGVVAALVAGLVSLRISERQIAIENITKERTRWREKIRELGLEVHKCRVANDGQRLAELRLEMAMSLNPVDSEDQAILPLVQQASDGVHDQSEEFERRIALLLKHDWERAKWEAKPVWSRGRAPKREMYAYNRNGKSS